MYISVENGRKLHFCAFATIRKAKLRSWMHTGTLFSFPVTWLHKHGQVRVYLGTLMSYEQETMDKSKKVEDYWIPARIRQDLFLFYYFRIYVDYPAIDQHAPNAIIVFQAWENLPIVEMYSYRWLGKNAHLVKWMELRFEIISLDTMTILIYRQRSIISNPIFFHLFFRSTKVFNANLCHFASRSPRFPIILRLTYGTRLRTNRLRHVSLFSSHRKKKVRLIQIRAFSFDPSILFSFSPPFFIFFSFTSFTISTIWQVVPIVASIHVRVFKRFSSLS